MPILILLLGLFLFISAHSLGFLAAKTRARVSGAIGEARWRGVVALASLIGLILIGLGYSLARVEPVPLYAPATWTRHLSLLIMVPVFPLLFATYLPGRLQSAVVHPTLVAVALWAFAHLLANGNLADLLLFWSFLIWAVADLISLKYRPAPPVEGAPPGKFNDLIAIVAGLGLYGVFLFWAHAWLFGVAPLGSGAL